MPMNKARYPKSWKAIATFLKSLNNWECENCGRPCRRPGETDEQLEDRIGKLPQWKPDLTKTVNTDEFDGFGDVEVPALGRFTLTVAHLDHDPPNVHPDNLRPWCSVCHCRHDLQPEAMARKRQLKLEYEGQLRIPGC